MKKLVCHAQSPQSRRIVGPLKLTIDRLPRQLNFTLLMGWAAGGPLTVSVALSDIESETAQLNVKALPAEPQHLRGGCAVVIGKFERGFDA
jgi:hypothetical protein